MPLTQVQGGMLAGSTNTTTTIQSNGTTAITIDSSQNVGIKTTTPGTDLQVNDTTSMGTGSATADILSVTNNNAVVSGVAGDKLGIVMSAMSDLSDRRVGLYCLAGNSNFNNPDFSIFQTGQGIAYRQTFRVVASNGAVRIACENFANQPSSTNWGVELNNTSGGSVFFGQGTGTETQINFGNRNGIRGSIQTNATNTLYNTTSDYRLKENVAPMTGALAKVSQLKPSTYTWKVDGSDGQGFIAHELQAVIPDAVTGEKDAVDEDGEPKYQMVDTSFLVATLTAAIQELNAKVEAQAAEIAALKATP